MKFDHVAINVKNINESIEWYLSRLGGELLYQDNSWGLIETCGVKIAFTLEKQHPPHICFIIDKEKKKSLENLGHKFKKHRDGSLSTYINDNNGNYVEYLIWPRSKIIGKDLKNMYNIQLEKIKKGMRLVKKLL